MQINEELSLKGLRDAKIDRLDDRLIVHEWRDYAVEWIDHGQQSTIKVDGPPKGVSGLVIRYPGNVFRYENQLGLAELTIHAGGKSLPLKLEVTSSKFATLEEHRKFYFALVSQLSERAAALPFSISSVTHLSARQSSRPGSDLFAWHFLRERSGEVLAALRTILAEPRRMLIAEDRYLDLDQAGSVQFDAFVDAMARPGVFAAVKDRGQAAYTWPLAALFEDDTGDRFLPQSLLESRAEETLDTPEHRFVRSFLEELAGYVDRFQRQGWFEKLGVEARRPLIEFRSEVADALTTTFLAEVGSMMAFPWTSHILQRAYGYRDLLRSWQEFHEASDPFQPLERAIDVRDVATLYEWWCFYELARRVEMKQGQAQMSAGVGDDGLLRGRVASFEGSSWTLQFNKTFPRGWGHWKSYSLTLRPDLLLARNGEPTVIFDAKFRLDAQDFTKASDPVADGENGPDAEPLDGDGNEPLAKKADIYKMHTYRDALRLEAAIALVPGGAEVFYDWDGPDSSGVLGSLLAGDSRRGVGAVPLSPLTPAVASGTVLTESGVDQTGLPPNGGVDDIAG